MINRIEQKQTKDTALFWILCVAVWLVFLSSFFILHSSFGQTGAIVDPYKFGVATNQPPLNDLVLWVRPESLATNAQWSKIARPDTTAGWFDSSGKGNHITNAVAADQATLMTNEFVGFNAARFDGTTNSMFVPLINLGTNWTLAMIYKEAVDGFEVHPLLWNSNLIAAASDSVNGGMVTEDGPSVIASESGHYTLSYHAAVWICSNGVVRMYFNGTDITETAQPTLTNNQTITVVGAKADGGHVNAASPQFIEILGWTNALSGSIRTNLDNYIMARYPFTFYTNNTSDGILAASGSLADVQDAVDLAVDGDTVLIPDDTETWTGGISTTKQIIIRAQNYTPTPAGTEGAGATTRNVTITHNSSADLFTFTSGNSFHCGIGGIRINQGSGTGSILRLTGSGTKPPLIFDMWIQTELRFGGGNAIVDCTGLQGGVMWNTIMDGSANNSTLVGEGSFVIKDVPRAWTTASTMGTNDTGGLINFYVEDSTFIQLGNCPDIDNGGRFVARHFIYNGTWGETHGFTSTNPGRHFEYYDGQFKVTMTSRNMSSRYFYFRGGTGLFADCSFGAPPDPGEYPPSPRVCNIGDTTSPTSYPQNQQPGYGHNGSAHVSDPIYLWNHTGAQAYDWSLNGSWGDNVQLDRDIFVNSGAKPNYAKFTYPHPLRSVIE